MPALALGAVFCLIALANLAPIINNDTHAQIRVGADIVASHQIPHVETYSATASGRPFTAHEWLASVIFYGLDKLGGGKALSLLHAAAVLACALLLWLTARRRDALTVPIFLLCLYLVSWRAAVRPHLFSLLALAAVAFALERWRASGRFRDLAWLVPMQVLWINLHGEAPLGPALVGAMAAGEAALVWVFKRRTPKHVLQLAATSAAMALACLANPYGWKIFQFSQRLMTDDVYMHQLVWEWRSPFAETSLRDAALWIFYVWLLVLALLWLGLLRRFLAKPLSWEALVPDLALALFATLLSVQANRFVAYAGLLGFGVLARSFEAKGLRRRPLLELAAACGLAAVVVFGGGLIAGPDRQRDRRPFGWGYFENAPFDEVAFIREKGFTGPIFNEYVDGSLIIRELAPAVKPVIDSRIDVYGAELTGEYFRALKSTDLFSAYLRKYGVRLVLGEARESNRGLYETLHRDPEWRQAGRFRHRFLFVRDQ